MLVIFYTTSYTIKFYQNDLAPKLIYPLNLHFIIICNFLGGHSDILQEKVSQGKFLNWIRDCRGRVSFLLEPSTY